MVHTMLQKPLHGKCNYDLHDYPPNDDSDINNRGNAHYAFDTCQMVPLPYDIIW